MDLPQQGHSNEYQQEMFGWSSNKIYSEEDWIHFLDFLQG